MTKLTLVTLIIGAFFILFGVLNIIYTKCIKKDGDDITEYKSSIYIGLITAVLAFIIK